MAVTEALMDAQIAIARAGFQMPVMEISEGAYYRALADNDRSVRAQRPGTTCHFVGLGMVGEGFSEIWTTPEQEREFQFAGPDGYVTIRRAVSP